VLSEITLFGQAVHRLIGSVLHCATDVSSDVAERGPNATNAESQFQRRKPPKSDVVECKGKIVESLPNCMFRVQLEPSKRIILAALSGNIRKNKLRVVLGDTVLVDVSVYDVNRGRIVVRYR
jgi:translation initiation factor IF-1